MKYILLIVSLLCCLLTGFAQTTNKTENVILITFDGFRWQELFKGADSSFMRQQAHLKDPKSKEKYWREDLTERRKALLPFFWNTIVTKGQLYGNRDAGSNVNVTNNQWFSYPGYNEILTGKADNERIHSNDKIYNPNTTVLEFINKQAAFKGKVAAFTSWDCFPYIINDKRSGIYVSTEVKEVKGDKLTDAEKMMNKLVTTVPNPLGEVRLDAFTFYYALEYMKKNKPRVTYIAFDETDDFAHGGEYGAYLNSAHNTDKFIGELWDYIQSDSQYKNKTTIIITTDHGRGPDPEGWKHHGANTAASDQIWFAVIGPDTKPSGEAKTSSQYHQNQIAKTIASLLNLDYKGEGTIGDVISTVVSK